MCFLKLEEGWGILLVTRKNFVGESVFDNENLI